MPVGQGRTRRKVRESNPQGLRSSRFERGAIARAPCTHGRLDLPYHEAAAAGIEPASGRLTAAYPYQHGFHRTTKSGRRDLNPRSRAPDDQRCASVPGGIPGFPMSCLRARSKSCCWSTSCDVRRRTDMLGALKSAQRESNSHFRHAGTAAQQWSATGCRRPSCARCPHGRIVACRIVNEQEHRAGVEPALPRYECGVLASGRPVRFSQWDRWASNPHCPV